MQRKTWKRVDLHVSLSFVSDFNETKNEIRSKIRRLQRTIREVGRGRRWVYLVFCLLLGFSYLMMMCDAFCVYD